MKKPFKRILYGGDYNPNQWPKEIWQEDMRMFRDAHINSATINVFSWAKLQPSEETYDFEELDEIVKMVGMDALSPGDRLKMEAARSIREDFLHQNSFHEIDTYTSLKKQHMMMLLVNAFYDRAVQALAEGASLQKLISMPVREQIGRFKYVREDALDEEYRKVDEELTAQIAGTFEKEGR